MNKSLEKTDRVNTELFSFLFCYFGAFSRLFRNAKLLMYVVFNKNKEEKVFPILAHYKNIPLNTDAKFDRSVDFSGFLNSISFSTKALNKTVHGTKVFGYYHFSFS